MKQILFIVAIVFPTFGFSQTNSNPPKLRAYSSFWTTKYELGEKDVSKKEIQLHLEKTSSEAYHYWRKAKSAEVTALIFTSIAGGGLVYGLTADGSTNQAAGLVVGSGASLVALFAVLANGSREDRAITTYNRKYGY